MKIKHEIFLFAFCLAAVVYLTGCGNPAQKGSQPHAPARSLAPSFSLKDLSGRTVSLDQFRGKVVVLDFWATWCPPCRQEIPHLIDLYNRDKEKNFVLIGISVDDEGAKVVKPFVKEFKITYPVLIADDKVKKDFGPLEGIPTKVIIDKKGNIVEKLIGYQNIQTIEKKIEPLL